MFDPKSQNYAQDDPGRRFIDTKSLLKWSFIFWSVPVVFRAIQSYFAHIVLEVPARFAFTVPFILSDWYYWVAVTPIAFALGSRFPIGEGKTLRSLSVHIPVALVAALLHIAIISAFLFSVSAASYVEIFARTASSFSDSLIKYVGILTVCFLLSASRRYRDRELLNATLKSELSSAQIKALQMQLTPHFLFNTLNSISALTHRQPDDANKMIARLSDLLRRLLMEEPASEIALEKELELLKLYLGIEEVRFNDRLSVEYQIEPETLSAQVPSLLLQPLVENAIRHGVSKRRGKGSVVVSARESNGTLEIRITNTMPERQADGHRSGGIGLKNTAVRLQKLYGNAQKFAAGPEAEASDRFLVTITLPLRKIYDA